MYRDCSILHKTVALRLRIDHTSEKFGNSSNRPRLNPPSPVIFQRRRSRIAPRRAKRNCLTKSGVVLFYRRLLRGSYEAFTAIEVAIRRNGSFRRNIVLKAAMVLHCSYPRRAKEETVTNAPYPSSPYVEMVGTIRSLLAMCPRNY